MTTQHTCGGPVFGRKTPGCPRCDELLAGAPPVRQPGREAHAYLKALHERSFRQELATHDCKARRCGPVCTFGEW